MTESKSVYVVGTGTIGEPLIGLFSDYKSQFGIDEVIFHKHSPREQDVPRMRRLMDKGATLAVDEAKCEDFKRIGLSEAKIAEEVVAKASVVIDCTPKGYGLENKAKIYAKHENTARGFIAQGSEFGFGKMFVHGVNNESFSPANEKYMHVVSCNTHNLSVLINTLALSESPDNLLEGQFVCMRRSTDVGAAEKAAPAPSVGIHKDAQFGTHHAKDANELFKTLGLDLKLFSSAVALNTQYMHSIWFDLRFAKPTNMNSIVERLEQNPNITLTDKDSSNVVFSFGRDYGYYGRILNNTVVNLPSLHLNSEGTELRGFCFTPQDGNSLISSVAGALMYLDPETYIERMGTLDPYLFDRI